MPLAVVTRSGTTPSSSEANQSPVRQKPDWISSAMNTTPCSVHQAASAGRKPGAGTTKPPSPWIGSITTQARLSAPTCFSSYVDRAGRGVGAGQSVAEGVGHRRAVDLAGERPEAVLVGHVLGRHRHREVGPAVVGVVEDRHRVAAGRHAGDLDGVLDRLGAGVEERGLLGVLARGQLGELLADVDVAVVRRDHEAGVGEGGDLLLHPATRRTGAALPTETTAMPEPRSISELPSTSTITPPPAATTKTGSVVPTPSATCAFLRSSARAGPGMSVTRRRSWGRTGRRRLLGESSTPVATIRPFGSGSSAPRR